MSSYQTAYVASNVDYELMRARQQEEQRREEERQRIAWQQEQERLEREQRRREQEALAGAVSSLRSSSLSSLEASVTRAFELQERQVRLRDQQEQAERYRSWLSERAADSDGVWRDRLRAAASDIRASSKATDESVKELLAQKARLDGHNERAAEAALRGMETERAADARTDSAIESARCSALAEAKRLLRSHSSSDAERLGLVVAVPESSIQAAERLSGREGLASALQALGSARTLAFDAVERRAQLAAFQRSIAAEVAFLEGELDKHGARRLDSGVCALLSTQLAAVRDRAQATSRWGDLNGTRDEVRRKMDALRDQVTHISTIAANLPALEKARQECIKRIRADLKREFGCEFEYSERSELPQQARRLQPQFVQLVSKDGRVCDAWLSLDGMTQLHHHRPGENVAECAAASSRAANCLASSFVGRPEQKSAHGAGAPKVDNATESTFRRGRAR